MENTSPVPWRRYSTDGAVIVFSSLLAFWIDAGWQEPEGRKREMVVLEALLGDLQHKRDPIDQQRSYDEAILAAMTKLLVAGASGTRGLDQKQIDKLLGNIVVTRPTAARPGFVLSLQGITDGNKNCRHRVCCRIHR